MGFSLPFRRYDVIDSDLHVVLRGATLETMVPAAGERLEPEVEFEVQRLRREPVSSRSTSVVTGLLGLEYGIRLLRYPSATGSHALVCVERLSIRGSFTQLSQRANYTEVETEAARLLVAGASDSVIAWRLGLAPIDAKSLVRTVLNKARLPDRGALARSVYGRAAGHPRPAQTFRSA